MKPTMVEAFQFSSFSDWVNSAQRRYEGIPVHLRPGFAYDAKGRRCWKGLEMQRARDEGAFPVRVFIAPELVVEP